MGVGLWEPADSAESQDVGFSHALEPLRGPADPKAFGHCRRAPQGEIGKAGRGHLQFSRKTGNPYKIIK